MPLYYQVPFGSAGDRDTVPVDVQVDGSVSYTEGYGADYSLPRATDPSALTIERTKYNEIIYDITSNIQQYQQHGVPEFITTSDNGGTAYPYAKGALVRYNNGTTTENYISKTNSNTALPTNTTYWTQVSGNTAYLNATQTFSGTCTFSNTIVGDISGNSGTVTTINGLLAAGSNITLTGIGTSASPYIINSNGAVAISGTPTSGQFSIWTGPSTIEGVDASTARTDLGLGTSATKNTGTATGDVVLLEDVGGSPGLPAVDGSQLTGIPNGANVKVYQVQNQIPSGTSGSTATKNAWTNCVPNTEVLTEVTGASLTTGVISLPAGTYEAFFSFAAFIYGGTGAACSGRLRNTTAGVTLGRTVLTAASSYNGFIAKGNTKFTLSGTTNIELQYFFQNAGTPYLGADRTTSDGEVTVIADVYFRKVA